MNEIKEFIEQYISDDSNNEEYQIDSLTDFVYLDKHKVDKDIDMIREFLVNHILYSEGISSIYWLLYNNQDEKWNELKSLKDLRVLNEVYALSIATGIIKNSISLRFINYVNTKNRQMFYTPKSFDFRDQNVRDVFFEEFREQLLPRYCIDVDVTLKKQYIHPALMDDRIRNIISYWWTNGVDDATVEEEDTFNCLVEYNPNDILNLMVYLEMNDFDSKAFLKEIRNSRGRQLIEHANEYIRNLSPKDKKKFNLLKAKMMNNLAASIKETQKVKK